jgi:hypothetical protein
MQPRPADDHVDAADVAAFADLEVLLVEMEKRQEVDEIRLEEAQPAQVEQLVLAEAARIAGRSGRRSTPSVRQRNWYSTCAPGK